MSTDTVQYTESDTKIHKIKKLLIPDPSDERDVCSEWVVKKLRVILDSSPRG